MITMSLRDPKLIENFKAVQELKKVGLDDKKIQELYDKQVETDREKGGMNNGSL